MDTVNPGENAEQGHVIQMLTFAESTDCFHCGKLLQVNNNHEIEFPAFTENLNFMSYLLKYDSIKALISIFKTVSNFFMKEK